MRKSHIHNHIYIPSYLILCTNLECPACGCELVYLDANQCVLRCAKVSGQGQAEMGMSKFVTNQCEMDMIGTFAKMVVCAISGPICWRRCDYF